ncbi:MAG: hypothetical protein IJQ71_02770 [Clostridia bacterium]|nr:hypothetical protein [Clostridia bacterium]
MFWILLGVLLVLCIRNNFNAQGVAKDLRGIARAVRKIIKDAARTIRHAARDAKRGTVPTAAAEPARETAVTAAPVAAEPVRTEAPKENELLKELEQHARTAAMMVDVPTIAFPKDDPKYDSSKKYMYA